MPPNSGSPGTSGSLSTGPPNNHPPNNNNNQPRPHPSMQGMPSGGPVNSQMPPGSMTMKMVPQGGMQQQVNGRVGVPNQTSPDNARVIREANRVQEQQRLLQSRQQQHQFQGPQYNQQGSHNSPNMNNVNPNPNNPAMLSAMQGNNGMGSPSYQNPSLAQNVSSASPRMGQPNPLSSGVVPTISNLQSSIQRNNPNMTSEQVNKLATERLHQYQQQRMSQVAMNAAAGNIGAVSGNYQVPPDVNMQHPPSQTGMSNGSPPVQNSQIQGYSPMMRVSQPGPPNRVGVGSPAVNGTMPQQSRSATPQNQRSGSAQLNTAPGSNKSPRAPPVQMANG